MTDHPSLNDNETTLPVSIKKALLARKLKKVAGLTFRGTDDLRNHFKLDHKTGVVEVFHHTSFLKEHLRLTKDGNYDASRSDSRKKCASFLFILSWIKNVLEIAYDSLISNLQREAETKLPIQRCSSTSTSTRGP